ncbi:MAG TPA: CehA/McbA family metallohydrolase [Anaerolineaceae bacterium]
MNEIAVSLHMHTWYSDGHGSHMDIVRAALKTGLDAVIVTDHNVLVHGLEGYYQEGGRRLLLLVGEELHDRTRIPQKNHLLVFGAGRELSAYAGDPQRLIDQARSSGGLAFIAHPIDPAMPAFGEDDISWEDWRVTGYTGIELWNSYSEIKTVAHSVPEAVFYAFFPSRLAHNPIPATIQRWDELLCAGKKVVAIGGADAHAIPKSLGPLHKIVFPYTYHFRAINTHLQLEKPLSGDIHTDRKLVYQALQSGHAFVGYDLPAPTRGFRFTAQGRGGTAWMGDEIPGQGGITLQVHLPSRAECRLIKNGKLLKTWTNRENCTHMTSEPGIYRVEAFREAFGRRRGWIFSNPIYVME